MTENIVIGNPIVNPWELLALSEEDWNKVEKEKTLFTNERFLPKLMIEAGIVNSISEVRRNQPKLVRILESLDFLDIKWGKKRLFILVGE